MQLQSYLAGRWQAGSGRATALRDASTGDVIAETSSEGFDFRGNMIFDRDRTVSDDVAARYFSFTTGWVSASSVVSHTEPHQTPWAPSAMAAAIWRPRPIPLGEGRPDAGQRQ